MASDKGTDVSEVEPRVVLTVGLEDQREDSAVDCVEARTDDEAERDIVGEIGNLVEGPGSVLVGEGEPEANATLLALIVVLPETFPVDATGEEATVDPTAGDDETMDRLLGWLDRVDAGTRGVEV